MNIDAPSITTDTTKNSWLKKLWCLLKEPIGDRLEDKDTANSIFPGDNQTNSQDATNTRSPELAPPETVIESQTLQAFSDYDSEYDPNNVTFAYLIPDELSLLNLSSKQTQGSTQKKQDSRSLSDTASEPSKLANSDRDEPLFDLIPLELSTLSEKPAA